ncbi:MAG TPA: metal ABC transporter ATP-binding protein, partial [Rectinemataceae bacterium]
MIQRSSAAHLSAGGKVAVSFSDVSFSHKEARVLDKASFHIHRGEFVVLVGANGSGKTTILRLIMGLAKPQKGRIEVLGFPPGQARVGVGYVPQGMSYDPAFPISVADVVRMGRLDGLSRSCIGSACPDLDEALELTGVADLKDRPYPALSGGQRRRVLVARALASNPELLILDEPTANMDSESERRLFDVLGGLKGRTTILIATHDTAFVSALTDVVLCVGERAAGTVRRHASGPIQGDPIELYGGKALRVLHDTELSDDVCCSPVPGDSGAGAPGIAGP